MTAYATDTVENGYFTHNIVENGLRFESRYQQHDGSHYTVAIGWKDLETAEANYENARQSALKNADRLREKLNGMTDGTSDRKQILTLIRFNSRKLQLLINAGPPTWWVPKVGVERLKDGALALRFGWLRRAFAIWIEEEK